MSREPNVSPGGPGDPGLPPVPETKSTPKTAPAVGEVEDVKFTRAAALWSSLIAGFLILIVLLTFIAQNTASVDFTFLNWHWSLPLGVAILLAAVAGGLITGLVSAARMFQLRRVAKKNLQFARKS
ncbi:MAG: DUF1049 domain-containing protein [Mycobacterium sp.]|nr:DUF1049 domain-containing protein [Mycobacterium sp.]